MAFSIKDVTYNLGLNQSEKLKLEDVLQILPSSNGGRVNAYKNGSTVIINSDRLILNAKKDYLMLCGKEGVAITSPKGVNIDCDGDLHLFSNSEVYIGLPNKGNDYNFEKQSLPKTKADATANSKYEPLVLGLKLANLLQDLIILLKNTTVSTPSGQGFMSPEMMYNFACLQSRIPEILSTYAFIDGVSHESVDPPPSSTGQTPEIIASAQINPVASATPGATLGSSTSATTGTAQNNVSGTPVPDITQQAQVSGSQSPAADPANTEPTATSTNPDGPINI